ncbi:hypothetical protein BCV69DRAFT_299046 [Microstroma glucosiphilum]|uniref:BTB domain-containing protein n=1 Tax=Pseudomicrostroma glucosiphilum TaxID=1684307 RepID=A0A316U6U6_9BASI|nr:hypothetical protein BCV69DRAFT_299046 [Pseudomicrostroma glucosiphilum]PWN20564.1 hypothetical protein BCV69DRAFT_299046 [Pseudomicrostroma glucosiphilum]
MPAGPSETHSLIFEWPLTGLRQLFDSSRADVKSKVVKSVTFGGGRWAVLFYAQSGLDQFCSLYLNAEPLEEERRLPAGLMQNKLSEQEWVREGLYSFTFTLQTLDKTMTIGTKEAHSHAYSSTTSNWGWAQFAKRDATFYANARVKEADGFLITVSVHPESEKPRTERPEAITVPSTLIKSVGSLLDDPDLSDVVFLIKPSVSQRPPGRPKMPTRKIYAMKKVLAARSKYFRDMFESGFQEGEADDDSDAADDASFRPVQTPASPSNGMAASSSASASVYDRNANSGPAFAGNDRRQTGGVGGMAGLDDDDYCGHEPLLDDSDAELDMPFITRHSKRQLHPIEILSDDEEDQVLRVSALAAERAPREQDNTNSAGDAGQTTVGEVRQSVSDISLEGSPGSPADATPSPSKRGKRERSRTANHEATEAGQSSSSLRSDKRKRRKVVVRDSSYTTFKALLFYLYTDTVEFAPLTSSFIELGESDRDPVRGPLSDRVSPAHFCEDMLKAHQRRQAIIDMLHQKHPDRPTACSAKSMYRLADKLNLTDLKSRAHQHIATHLDSMNIVWEAFSSFTCRYPDILKIEVDYLLRNWKTIRKGSPLKSVFARGHAHPGLGEVWPVLLKQLTWAHPPEVESEDEDSGAPPA